MSCCVAINARPLAHEIEVTSTGKSHMTHLMTNLVLDLDSIRNTIPTGLKAKARGPSPRDSSIDAAPCVHTVSFAHGFVFLRGIRMRLVRNFEVRI